MPRGLSVYNDALIQNRLWTPRLLGTNYYVGFSAKDINAIACTTGASIDSWRDLHRNNLIVTPVSTKPTYIPSKYKGNPCVSFSSSPMNSNSATTGGTTYSWLCLAKDNNVTAIRSSPFSIGGSPGGTRMHIDLDFTGTTTINTLSGFNGAVLGNASNSPIKTTPTLIGIGLDSGVGWASINGIYGTDGGSGVVTNDNQFRIGGSWPVAGLPFNGDIYCILAISSRRNSPNFLKAEGWIAWEFNVPELLPATHPYSRRPPLTGD